MLATDWTYLSRLVSHIIGNVQINLSDVLVRYDCDPSALAQVREARLLTHTKCSKNETLDGLLCCCCCVATTSNREAVRWRLLP